MTLVAELLYVAGLDGGVVCVFHYCLCPGGETGCLGVGGGLLYDVLHCCLQQFLCKVWVVVGEL